MLPTGERTPALESGGHQSLHANCSYSGSQRQDRSSEHHMPEALIELCRKHRITDHPASHYVLGNDGEPGPIPWGKNYFNRRFREFRERLHLPPGYKFYSLKHTAAGKLLESGESIVEVRNHLGHRDFESTIRYIRRHFGERSEKVANFRPDFLKGL